LRERNRTHPGGGFPKPVWPRRADGETRRGRRAFRPRHARERIHQVVAFAGIL
jgi:hypothetical protein